MAVRGCSYHDKLPFRHSSLITLDPAPLWPLAVARSIAWSVHTSVLHLNPNTSPKELQLSSLGYFPSLRDELLVIPTRPVVTRAERIPFHTLITLTPYLGRFTSGLASWLHHHPQTNGETEQVNQELETYLRLFTSNKPKEWSTLLPMAEFAHNSSTHSVTQKT